MPGHRFPSCPTIVPLLILILIALSQIIDQGNEFLRQEWSLRGISRGFSKLAREILLPTSIAVSS